MDMKNKLIIIIFSILLINTVPEISMNIVLGDVFELSLNMLKQESSTQKSGLIEHINLLEKKAPPTLSVTYNNGRIEINLHVLNTIGHHLMRIIGKFHD